MVKEVLLLNASEEILNIISWKKAVKLLESGRAKKPYNYSKTYSIKTSKGNYKLPAALVLVNYVVIPHNNFSPTRRNIFKRDNWTCQYCGFSSKNPKNLTIDHVHPQSKGGGTQWSNLVTACPKCNSRKGNKLLKECGLKLKRKPKKPNFYAMKLIGLDEHGKQIWSRWINL